jgi:uncharacterized Zn-finger protein
MHKMIHSGQLPYKCEWPGCEKAFPLKRRLEVHRSCHIGLRTVRCEWPECGQMFRLFMFFNHLFSNHKIFFGLTKEVLNIIN